MSIDLQSTALVPHWARRDPVRNETVVRIKFQPRVNYAVGDTVYQPKKLKDGWAFADVYESELERIMEDVETEPHLIAAAERTHINRLRTKAAAQAKMTEKELPLNEADWPEEAKLISRKYTGSMEAEFQNANLRGIKPLIACEVVERLGLPKNETQQLIAAAVTEAVSAAVKSKK